MKRVLFYCQHVLGMGHLVRSMEVARGLQDCEVCFLNGGEIADGIALPPNIRFVHLPVLKCDEDFNDIHAASGQNVEHVKEQRRAQVLHVLEEFQPDAAVIELFPFGRRKFGFELMPMLEQIRLRHASTKVACSLRDIVVSKPDRERYERKVRTVMDAYFDLLLVHSDPAFQSLDESFASADRIRCPIEYTGFVVRQPGPSQSAPRSHAELPRIVVSIGGGRVGCELLEAAMEASACVAQSIEHELEVFTGPFLQDEEFSRLSALAATQRSVKLQRFTPSLPQRLEEAALSISMAGYNTCMDVIVTGVPALLYPFTGGGNLEQTTRAQKLQALGAATILARQDLEPRALAEVMLSQLTHQKPRRALSIDIDGVRKTSASLRNLMDIQ
jgi:predicted glycosyltransferase